MARKEQLERIRGAGAGVERDAREGTPEGEQEFLTLRQAAAMARTTEKSIRARAEVGILRARRTVRDGRILTLVRRRDVCRIFPAARVSADSASAPPDGLGSGDAGAGSAAPTAQDAAVLAELRSRVQDAEAAVRTARETLATAQREHAEDRGRLEGLRRALEAHQAEEARLRTELEGTRRELLSVARALGQAEGEVRRLLAAHGSEGAAERSKSRPSARLGVAGVTALAIASLALVALGYQAWSIHSERLENRAVAAEQRARSEALERESALRIARDATAERDVLRAEIESREVERSVGWFNGRALPSLFGTRDG